MGMVKLSDFGLSARLTGPKTFLYQQCGTPGYIAPEMINVKKYNQKADMFSAGCVLYSMYYFLHQFQQNTKCIIYRRETHNKTIGCLEKDLLKGKQYEKSFTIMLTMTLICLRNAGKTSVKKVLAAVSKPLLAQSLVLALMKKNPESRLSAEEALNHPAILKAAKKEVFPTPMLTKREIPNTCIDHRAILMKKEGIASCIKVQQSTNDRMTSELLSRGSMSGSDNSEEKKNSLEEIPSGSKDLRKGSDDLSLTGLKKYKNTASKTSTFFPAGEHVMLDPIVILETAAEQNFGCGIDESPTKGAYVVDEGPM